MKKERLKGTIDTNHNLRISIVADDGDCYNFVATEKFEVGDRVSFLSSDAPEAFSLALMGEPIPAIEVLKIMNDESYIDK